MRRVIRLRPIGPIGPIGLISPISPIGLIGLIRLIGLIGLIGLMSCSSDHPATEVTPETPEVNTPIVFSGGMSDSTSVTRATGLEEENVTSFIVWGHKNMSGGETQTVMDEYHVQWIANSAATTTTNSCDWEYLLTSYPSQHIKYWDWSAAAYRFFAVASTTNDTDYNVTVTKNADNTELTFNADASSTTTMGKTAYYSRLWYSTGVLPEYIDKQFGKPVTLEFQKPFTRVRFIFRFTFPREGITLTETSFKPTNGSDITLKGEMTITFPLTGGTEETFSMTPSADPGLAAFTEDFDPDDDGKTYSQTDNGWYTVLPNASQGSYTLTVKVNNDLKSATVPAAYMQWKPGYSYTYVFKILEEGGVEIELVESAYTGWVETEIEHIVYNW